MIMKKLILFAGLLAFSVAGFTSGGKNRLGDEQIDEVYQLCQQLGVEEGSIEYEVCTGPEDGNCVVVRVDCSQAPEE